MAMLPQRTARALRVKRRAAKSQPAGPPRLRWCRPRKLPVSARHRPLPRWLAVRAAGSRRTSPQS